MRGDIYSSTDWLMADRRTSITPSGYYIRFQYEYKIHIRYSWRSGGHCPRLSWGQ